MPTMRFTTPSIDKNLFVMLSVLSGAILVLSSACASTQQTGPTIYSSATSLSYASEYPSRLEALNKKIDEVSAKARNNWLQFNRYAGDLADPRWDEVKTVYEKADLAGRSEAMVDWIRQSETVTGFIEANDVELSQRIGAHVNAQINKDKKGKEEKPADGEKEFDARPFVRWALKNATSKLVDDRYRQLNDAHRLLVAYGESLGKKNIKVLESQVDKITETSFIVNVALFDLRAQMQARVQETDEVKRTLDNEIERLQLISDAPESSKKDKAEAKETIGQLLKTKAPIDADVQKAKTNLDGFEQRLQQYQKEYQDAFIQLIQMVDQKATEKARATP